MARGRKASPTLWRADAIDTQGPICVQGLASPMAQVLGYVGSLPDPDFFDDKVLTISSIHFRYAVADVIRRRWNPKMKCASFGKPLKAATRNMAKAEGLVLSRLLSIISEVFLFDNGGYAHPAYWWLDCALELGAHRPALITSNESDGKLAILRAYQRDTGRLQRRENPFMGAANQRLFDVACRIADASTGGAEDRDSELFFPSKFLPYLEARSKLADFIRKKGSKILKEKPT